MSNKIERVEYETASKEFWDSHKDCIWGDLDTERLTATSIDEAIEEILDQMDPEIFPESWVFSAYRPMEVPLPDEHRILDYPLEYVDEEYGDPEGDGPDKPTEAMLEAARHLARVIKEEYKPWAHEEVARVVLKDVRKWVEENRSHWLKDIKFESKEVVYVESEDKDLVNWLLKNASEKSDGCS